MMQVLHPKDRALFEAMPMLMSPRFGQLPHLEVGQRRLLAARDGIYLEAKTKAVHICRRVSELSMPYGDIKPFIRLRYGQPPKDILAIASRYSASHPTTEVAACLMLDQAKSSYRWHFPEVISNSSGHISYRDDIDDDELVIDYHSHAMHPAYFSEQDDSSDMSRPGPYIAVVAGHCHTAQQSMASRLVCAPYLMPLVNLPTC